MTCTIPNCTNIANPDNVAPDGVHCDRCRGIIQSNYAEFEIKYGEPRAAYVATLQALNAYLGEQARLTAAVIAWMSSTEEVAEYRDLVFLGAVRENALSLNDSVRISVQAAYSK